MSGLTRRVVIIGVITALVATAARLSGLTPHTALAAPGGIVATSVTPILLGRGTNPDVSGDGRFIAFNPIYDLNDRGVRVGEAGVSGAVQIEVNGQGQFANSSGDPARMSADGRHVVFNSYASNLTPADATAGSRIYTLDRDVEADGIFDEAGYTTLRRVPGRVSVGADSFTRGPADADISDSGRYVAFAQPDVEGADNCLRAYRLDRDVDANGIFDEPGTSSVIDVTVSTAGASGSLTG